jgi:hypothetical protein
LLISYVRSKLNAAGEISDAQTLAAVKLVLERLIKVVRDKPIEETQ